MKKAIPYLIAEIILSLTISLLNSKGILHGFLAMFGAINLVLGVIGLIFGVIFSIAKQESISKGLLISSSLLILMGFLTCSAFAGKF